jgi:hypothetical protein
VLKVDVEMQPDEVIDSFQCNFRNPSVIEKGNGSRHVPIKKNSSSSEYLSLGYRRDEQNLSRRISSEDT